MAPGALLFDTTGRKTTVPVAAALRFVSIAMSSPHAALVAHQVGALSQQGFKKIGAICLNFAQSSAAYGALRRDLDVVSQKHIRAMGLEIFGWPYYVLKQLRMLK